MLGVALNANFASDVKISYVVVDPIDARLNSLPSTIRYYDAKGTHLKTEVRSQYVCEAQVCQPGHFKMTDHTRKDASTVLIQKMEKMNSGLNDERFSQRALQQGR